MKKIEVEVLSEATNAVVLKTPGRQFPGIVLQGDSLSNLYRLAEEIVSLGSLNEPDRLSDTAAQLKEALRSFLIAYEDVLHRYDLPLPYISPFSADTTQKK